MAAEKLSRRRAQATKQWAIWSSLQACCAYTISSYLFMTRTERHPLD